MIICDTFSRFDGDDDDYGRELEAFVTDSYQKYDGTVILRTRTWITFSQLTRLIRWLKKYEFLNNTVRFGDMLVVNKRDGVQQGFRIIKSIKFLSGNLHVYYIVESL